MNLNMKKTYNATPDFLFDAWTNPEIIKKWFSPDGKWAVDVAEMNFSLGGNYRIEMRSPEGRVWSVHGTYREIKLNKKLVFTWNTDDVKDTIVSVEFREIGEKTEVNVFHDLLPTQEQVDEHIYGWKGCMENLGAKVFV